MEFSENSSCLYLYLVETQEIAHLTYTCQYPYNTFPFKFKAIYFYYTPIRIAKIKNTQNTKCWWECGAIGTLSTLLVEIQNCATTSENSLAVSYKVKYTLIIKCSKHIPRYLRNRNLCSYKTCTQSLQQLYSQSPQTKRNNLNVLQRANELANYYIHMMEYYSGI